MTKKLGPKCRWSHASSVTEIYAPLLKHSQQVKDKLEVKLLLVLCRTHKPHKQAAHKLLRFVHRHYEVACADTSTVATEIGPSIKQSSHNRNAQSLITASGTPVILINAFQATVDNSLSHETGLLRPAVSQSDINDAAQEYIIDRIIDYDIAADQSSPGRVQRCGISFGDVTWQRIPHLSWSRIVRSHHLCKLFQPPAALVN